MRTSAPVSTSDPTRTVRPPSSTISIAPGRVSVLAGVDGDDSVTGTKRVAGAAVAVAASSGGVPVADQERATPAEQHVHMNPVPPRHLRQRGASTSI